MQRLLTMLSRTTRRVLHRGGWIMDNNIQVSVQESFTLTMSEAEVASERIPECGPLAHHGQEHQRVGAVHVVVVVADVDVVVIVVVIVIIVVVAVGVGGEDPRQGDGGGHEVEEGEGGDCSRGVTQRLGLYLTIHLILPGRHVGNVW